MDKLLDFVQKTCPEMSADHTERERMAHSTFLNEQMPAFVAWTLFDSVIDGIDFVRTQIMDWMDVLDDEVTTSPKSKHMQHLHDMEEVLSTMINVRAIDDAFTTFLVSLMGCVDPQTPLPSPV